MAIARPVMSRVSGLRYYFEGKSLPLGLECYRIPVRWTLDFYMLGLIVEVTSPYHGHSHMVADFSKPLVLYVSHDELVCSSKTASSLRHM